MSITIVNKTDGTIATATVDAGSIWSGRNGHLANVYYHHNSSTPSELQARWYQRGITPDFPRSDSARIGLIVAGTFLTFIGVVGTILSFGALAPEIAAGTVTFWSGLGGVLAVVGTVGGVAMAVAPEVLRNKEALETVSQTGKIGSNGIVKFTGVSPFKTIEKDGKLELVLRPELLDSNGAVKGHIKQPTGHVIGYPQFDKMRRNGEIYQIKDKNGEYHDMTQGLINKNLQMPSNPVTIAGVTFDTSKIYQIVLRFPGKSSHYLLKAGEDEGDDRVYLTSRDSDEAKECQSNCYWQFIPARDTIPNQSQITGWILVDRRYLRPLRLKDGEIRQYQSEEPGILLQVDAKGAVRTHPEWAWLNKAYDMMWKIDGAGRICHQDFWVGGSRRMCVTARTDGGFQIYAREQGAHDVLQEWQFIPQ